MPNANRAEEKRALNYLNAEGVTDDKLNELLEEELNKPEDQIDMELVESILAELEPQEIREDEVTASWQRLVKKIDTLHSGEKRTHSASVSRGKTRKRWPTVLRSIGLIAAAAVILFYASIGTAKATRWTFLLKLLQPITETFGIKLGDDVDPLFEEEYISALDDGKMSQFSSKNEIPLEYEGYSIKLNGIPKRFSLMEGSFYPSKQMDSFDFAYLDGDDWLVYSINIFPTDAAGLEYLFETTMDIQEKRNVGMIEITIYQNDDAKTQYVSWVNKNAHYSLYGTILPEELDEIIIGIQ